MTAETGAPSSLPRIGPSVKRRPPAPSPPLLRPWEEPLGLCQELPGSWVPGESHPRLGSAGVGAGGRHWRAGTDHFLLSPPQSDLLQCLQYQFYQVRDSGQGRAQKPRPCGPWLAPPGPPSLPGAWLDTSCPGELFVSNVRLGPPVLQLLGFGGQLGLYPSSHSYCASHTSPGHHC